MFTRQTTNRPLRHAAGRALLVLGAGALLSFTFACGGGGGGSPTDPGMPGTATMRLTDASIEVDGESYEAGAGGTFHHNHGGSQGGSTRFEATLTRGGVPVTGRTVRVRYETPMGHGMMGGGAGAFHLYDDGTHGDHTPGDGVYHHEDHEGRYGFHHRGAHHGEYHYDFFGLHEDGTETNHMMIDVEVDD